MPFLPMWSTMHGEESRHVASLLKSAWALAAQRSPLGDSMRVSLVVERGLKALATLTRDGHRGLLLIPERSETLTIEAGLREQEGAALVAEIAHFSGSEVAAGRGIHVCCQDHALDEAFTMFCALVCIRAISGPVAQALSASFEEFRALFGASQIRLTPDVVGLVGELLWLDRLSKLAPTAACSWVGPSGSRHDFRSGQTAVEVKTSLRSASQATRVRITSLDQLVPPDGGRLFLHAVRLERAAKGEVSLRVLIDGIRRQLSHDLLEYFDNQLAEIGDLGKALDDAFSVLSQETFEVRDGFPRLVPESLAGGSLAAGVASVSYELLLDFALEFRVESDVAVALMAGSLR